jgi:hypothetical protein
MHGIAPARIEKPAVKKRQAFLHGCGLISLDTRFCFSYIQPTLRQVLVIHTLIHHCLLLFRTNGPGDVCEAISH